MPDEAEALGLLALMELQASRGRRARRRRRNLVCSPIRRARWTGPIARGLAWLARAGSIEHSGAVPAPGGHRPPVTPARRRGKATEWPRIVALYATLAEVAPRRWWT